MRALSILVFHHKMKQVSHDQFQTWKRPMEGNTACFSKESMNLLLRHTYAQR